MSAPELPASISTVTTPSVFWPSAWSAMEECRLKVWGARAIDDPLPESPEAMFGTLLHEVRKRFKSQWTGEGDPRQRVKATYAQELAALEARLVANGLVDFVPLETVVGWYRCADRLKDLRGWAAVQRPRASTRQAREGGGEDARDDDGAATDAFATGTEPLWQCVELRLRGRPDEAWLDDDGDIVISDFKTGIVTDDEGEVLPSIKDQLSLYALMAEHLKPGRKVRLVLSGKEDRRIPWGPEERGQMLTRLRKFLDEHPAGTTSDASDVASPGRHCVGCRIRHRCGKYLASAPSWWPNAAGHPRPLPLDVWGWLESTRVSEGRITLWMRDPVSRRVQVDGVHERWGLEGAKPGQFLACFGLQPAEDVRPHGLPIQPRNFHERAPGPPWTSAVGARMYLEREG